jgi:hypothetical protein
MKLNHILCQALMPNSITSSHAYRVPLYHTFLLCLPTHLFTLNNFVIMCFLMAYACITFSDLHHSLGLHMWLFTLLNTAHSSIQQSTCLEVILPQVSDNQHNTFTYPVSILLSESAYHISNGANQISPSDITKQTDHSFTILVRMNTMQTLVAGQL